MKGKQQGRKVCKKGGKGIGKNECKRVARGLRISYAKKVMREKESMKVIYQGTGKNVGNQAVKYARKIARNSARKYANRSEVLDMKVWKN